MLIRLQPLYVACIHIKNTVLHSPRVAGYHCIFILNPAKVFLLKIEQEKKEIEIKKKKHKQHNLSINDPQACYPQLAPGAGELNPTGVQMSQHR